MVYIFAYITYMYKLLMHFATLYILYLSNVLLICETIPRCSKSFKYKYLTASIGYSPKYRKQKNSKAS